MPETEKPERTEAQMDALKRHCSGCHDDVYNHGCGGAKRCWMLRNMEIIKRKRVSIHQRPPWNQKAEKLPSCYSERGYVFVKPETTR